MWRGRVVLPLTGICIETYLHQLLLHLSGIRSRGMTRMRINVMPLTDLLLFYHLHQCPLHSHFGTRTCITLAGLVIACIAQKWWAIFLLQIMEPNITVANKLNFPPLSFMSGILFLFIITLGQVEASIRTSWLNGMFYIAF